MKAESNSSVRHEQHLKTHHLKELENGNNFAIFFFQIKIWEAKIFLHKYIIYY